MAAQPASALTVLKREAAFAGTGMIQRNPSAEQVAALIAQYPVSGALPATWTLFVDGRNKNLWKSVSRGLDFSLSTKVQGTAQGDFAFGLNGTVFTKYLVALTPNSPLTDQLNIICSPLRLKARATASWRRGAGQAGLVVNPCGRL